LNAALAICLCLVLAVAALAWEAEVIRVVDGDTLVVRRIDNDAQTRIRLYGIDAPEMLGIGMDASAL